MKKICSACKNAVYYCDACGRGVEELKKKIICRYGLQHFCSECYLVGRLIKSKNTKEEKYKIESNYRE